MADMVAAQMNRLALNPSMVQKRAPGSAGRMMEITSNFTPITLKKDFNYFKYDLRMNAIFEKRDKSEGVKEFSKQTRDDYNEQERKKACTEIFRYLVNTDSNFQGNLIYDRAAILYTTQVIPGLTADETLYKLPPGCQTVCPEAIRVEVTIKQAATSFQISSNDLIKCVNADFRGHSKELLEVLNLATSQAPFFAPERFITFGNGNIYLMDPASYGFQSTECPAIGHDKFIAIGLSKGVKILEGRNTQGEKAMPALVLDVKKTAFHFENQVLTDKIEAIYGKGRPSNANLCRDLKDIRCMTIHKKGSIVIGGFTPGPLSESSFKDNAGNLITVVQYYQTKYNVQIKRPDLPGVIDKHHRNIYPTEVLRVAPSQRVKGTQATKDTVEALIKVSAIKPEVRLSQTNRLSKLLELNSERAAAIGITVPDEEAALTVPARALPTVPLLGGMGSMTGPNWRGANKFVVGATLEKWATFCFFNSNSRLRNDPGQIFKGFINKLIENGNRKGMAIPQPCLVDKFDASTGYVEPLISGAMKKASEAGCTFVLVVSDDRLKSHDQLKCDELQYQVLTQEVTLSKANQVAFENKMQTLENIIMKMNAKLRGMNHVVGMDNGLLHADDAIIMGIFVQQPRSMTAQEIEGGSRPSMPAVIGLSCNNGDLQAAPPKQREMAAQQYFTTGWRYANPLEWKAGEKQRDTLKKMIKDALVQFKQYRGRSPMKVIVYRGGVSEGQLPYVASTERDVFMEAFHDLSPTYNPALVILACSKEHNERFYHKTFPQAEPGKRVDTNLAPGVIVDKVAVNPELNEFYLQSHKALQGTARATKYTLLHESSGVLTMDKIEHMTYSLCHLHEIVNSTTAIPTPLYVAEESAKRANNIYHHQKGGSEWYDLDEINEKLSPTGVTARINA